MSALKKLLFHVSSHSSSGHASLTLLRLTLGFSMLIAHAFPKAANQVIWSAAFHDPYGFGSTITFILALFTEFFGSILLILGLLTRLALIPLIFDMFTAFFVVHAGEPFAQKELAFLYFVGYIVLFISGPGRLSLDAVITEYLNKKQKPNLESIENGNQTE